MRNFGIIYFIISSAFFHGVYGVDYSDLEAMGKACPERDRCRGYRNNRSYLERSCECDFACKNYDDCCLDAVGRRSSRRSSFSSRVICEKYGEGSHQGVYVIGNCPSSWRGSSEVRQKCEGPADLSDPLNTAPVTSVAQAITYRNRYCAECNYAYMPTLKIFQVKMSCESLSFLTDEQIFADLTYNRTLDSWGVNRLDSSGDSFSFKACDIIFDVPPYLNNSVRFCRYGIISTCPPEWTRSQVRKDCEDYMAVVYDNVFAYRNVHCAICNNMTVDQVSCRSEIISRKRPMSFALLLDVNQSDGDQVGMRRIPTPECPSNHKYDPFFKKCRKLVCALPGFEVVDGRCVPPS